MVDSIAAQKVMAGNDPSVVQKQSKKKKKSILRRLSSKLLGKSGKNKKKQAALGKSSSTKAWGSFTERQNKQRASVKFASAKSEPLLNTKELEEAAREVTDGVIIIGGNNKSSTTNESALTRKLASETETVERANSSGRESPDAETCTTTTKDESVDDYMRQYEALSKELAKIKVALSEEKVAIIALDSEEADLIAQIEACDAEVKQQNERIAELEGELTNLEVQCDLAETAAQNKENELVEAQVAYKIQCSKQIQGLAEQEDDGEEGNTEAANLRQELSEITQENDKVRQQLADLEADVDDETLASMAGFSGEPVPVVA